MNEYKKIVIISDGTGKTAKRLTDAVLAQYTEKNIAFSLENIYPQIRTRKEFDEVLKKIDSSYLVIYSIISKDLSTYIHEQLADRDMLHINVLEPMLSTVSRFLGVHPDYRPGILHVIDDNYYKKVDAIGYTVEHDDGGGRLIKEADLVLLGLSRTCKTPISMYLACNFGLKVANIPVIRDAVLTQNLLSQLEPIPKNHIIGLTMKTDILAHIREERARLMTSSTTSRQKLQTYHGIREVGQEVKFCRDLFKVRRWRVIDVTRRAIEEVSLEILDTLNYQG